MSSYQFVNSLAACYNTSGGVGGGGTGNPGNPRGGGPILDPSVAAAAEYYGGGGGGNGGTGYSNCYSPQIPPGPGPGGNYYGGSGGTVSPPVMNGVDFRSGVVSPLGAAASCKYASGPVNNNNLPGTQNQNVGGVGGGPLQEASLASPQDLTTGSGASSGGSSCSTPHRSPIAGGGGKVNSQSNNNSSSNSATSPQGGGGGGGGGSGGSKGNPPQIYPWMKRVHLGQSKEIKYSLFVF
ncbi:Homeotic protein Sex combs reduced [Folsomia candida]|uniref:Homeotic protein Sex combs reduced n=1 Tax=Folsomia candida TaxID=158441 RepID=A0A226EFU8_FOLCA|nr:Homeotic protein Sex combs reduced [Folsomia candida]